MTVRCLFRYMPVNRMDDFARNRYSPLIGSIFLDTESEPDDCVVEFKGFTGDGGEVTLIDTCTGSSRTHVLTSDSKNPHMVVGLPVIE